MKFKDLVSEVERYFDIKELVSKRVYEKYKSSAWRFFDPRLLETLVVLRRDILCVPLVCNNWKSGGSLQQRGLRENVCDIVRKKTDFDVMYLSAHTIGMAVDLSSGKMTADEMRDKIIRNSGKLPYNVRIEDGESAPTWLHIDVCCPPTQTEKVVKFK